MVAGVPARHVGMLTHADELKPLCADLEDSNREFWRSLDMPLHQDCHVFVSASEHGFVSLLMWSGDRADGMAEGEGSRWISLR